MIYFRFSLFIGLLFFVIEPSAMAQSLACRQWDGNIKGNPVEACIAVGPDNKVTGTYFYFKNQQPIPLSGTVDPATQRMILTETGDADYPQKVTGNWDVILDEKKNTISGKFTAGKISQKLELYDLTKQQLTVKSISEVNYECDPEARGVVEYSYNHPVIESLPNPDVMTSINALIGQTTATWNEDAKKHSSTQPACDAPAGEEPYNNDGLFYNSVSYDVKMRGRFLVEVTFIWDAFTGGAHPAESGQLRYFDLRTGQEVPFMNLFTPEGQKILTDHIKTELAGGDGCEFDFNKVWSFGPDGDDISKPEDFPLVDWDISYGTYAFCTGRSGYSTDGLPAELVERGLNPVYFDPKTKFFY